MADAFYGPRSRQNARLLIETAQSLGLEARVIRTQVGGYLVPEKIVDKIHADQEERNEDTPSGGIQGSPEGVTNEADDAQDMSEEQEVVETKRPSQADSKAEWLAYAQGKGLDVTEDSTKAEIVEAVKKGEEETD